MDLSQDSTPVSDTDVTVLVKPGFLTCCHSDTFLKGRSLWDKFISLVNTQKQLSHVTGHSLQNDFVAGIQWQPSVETFRHEDCFHLLRGLTSFPGSSPAFCRILYSMPQKAGEEPGNEAKVDLRT